MVPEFSKLIRRVTFVLLALAAVAVEVAACDGRSVFQSVGLAMIWISIAALVGWFVPTPADPWKTPPIRIFVLLVVLASLPFAVEPLRRDWTGDGYPLEIQMVCGLRNVGLALAACAGWLLCQRMAGVVSLFLVLFSAAMTNHPVVLTILGLYAAAGSGWLMLAYWGGLKSVLIAPDRTVAVEIQSGRERLPWFGLSLLILALGAALALAMIGPRQVAFTLGEWVPTSGGTGDTDPFARHGVGDGPEETAGPDAKAAGMVETDRMIEDNKNSLIDAVSDLYGRPQKPPRQMERMVAAGKVEMIQNHGKLPDNRRPSRDFDTARKGPKNVRKPGSQDARGLFEIQGRTPLHVRLVVYEEYDAIESRWLEAGKPSSRFIEPQGGDWMKVGHFRGNADWYCLDERHRLKTADMTSNLVPTPAMLSRFRINKVDRCEYYDWDYEGVLVLAGRKQTPPGVVVTTDCRTIDPCRLPEAVFRRAGASSGTFPGLGMMPDTIRPEIARLAAEWAGDRPRGWSQIEAVLTKLRTEYVLDREAVAPADHPAPVLWFLAESRRGPDYLFATAAALLLRTLDHPARVCLGYYASPDAYDPETAHTPVRASDLHFWPEVQLRDGHWLVIEPTPGYDVLGPNLPLSERLLHALTVVGTWVGKHFRELILVLIALAVGWVRRRQLLDELAVAMWVCFPGRTWRDQVRGAVAVLERRGRWTGRARLRRQTIPSWLGACRVNRPEDSDLDRLTRMAEWAAYAPDVPPPWNRVEVRAVCQRVLGGWTLRRWREVKSLTPRETCR
jgi:protein-glutamine gamma-glutamyltransferase